MKYLFLSFFLLLLIFSCKENTPDAPILEKIEDKKGFENIEILFDETTFSDTTMVSLLKEINICSENEDEIASKNAPACSPTNFKFLPLRADLSLSNGFILLIKAETAGFPLRRVLVFERQRGKLTKLNGFVANIIGRTKTDTGYDDLLLRFNDNENGQDVFYNCLFNWVNGQYQYKQVEAILGANWGGPVKAIYKDSISKEILQTIQNNQMLF